MQMYSAFFTGSRVYGVPRPDSGLDLVVWCGTEREWANELFDAIRQPQTPEDHHPNYREQNMQSYRQGNLNIINCNSPTEWYIWKEGTERCRRQAPISRDRAIEIFKAVREEVRR